MRSFIHTKSDSKITYAGSWLGLSGATDLYLKDAVSLTDPRYGYFSNKYSDLFSVTLGTEGVALRENVDFAYGKRLDASVTQDPTDGFGTTAGGIIDTGTSGSLGIGKAFRIVDASSGTAKNVKDITGLNVKVYAVRSGEYFDKSGIYIDPIKGKYTMPYLKFWSTMNSLLDINSPKIGMCTNIPQPGQDGGLSYPAGKFSNCVQIYGGPAGGGRFNFVNRLGPVTSSMSKGSVSFWAYNGCGSYVNYINTFASFGGTFVSGGGWADAFAYSGLGWSIVFAGISPAGADTSIAILYIDSTEVARYTVTANAWNHIFVTWDSAKTLDNNTKTLRVFLNGVERISYTGILPEITPHFTMSSGNWFDFWFSYIMMDNLKFWDCVIEDPTFEYNAGTGIENAMFPVYGNTNGYQPKLTSPGGVGYRYLASSDTPAVLNIINAEFSAVEGEV